MMTQKKIGKFKPNIIKALNLNIPYNTPIYIGENNIEHIKKRHPYEYEKYYKYLKEIIENPDYVGRNPKDLSILLVRFYKISDEFIRVAIKINNNGNYYVKTLHLLSSCNAERYIEKGTLKKLDT